MWQGQRQRDAVQRGQTGAAMMSAFLWGFWATLGGMAAILLVALVLTLIGFIVWAFTDIRSASPEDKRTDHRRGI
jgi:hypothetical protein